MLRFCHSHTEHTRHSQYSSARAAPTRTAWNEFGRHLDFVDPTTRLTLFCFIWLINPRWWCFFSLKNNHYGVSLTIHNKPITEKNKTILILTKVWNGFTIHASWLYCKLMTQYACSSPLHTDTPTDGCYPNFCAKPVVLHILVHVYIILNHLEPMWLSFSQMWMYLFYHSRHHSISTHLCTIFCTLHIIIINLCLASPCKSNVTNADLLSPSLDCTSKACLKSLLTDLHSQKSRGEGEDMYGSYWHETNTFF